MDFRHPFFSKPRLAVYYALFWGMVTLAVILIQRLGNQIPWDQAVVDVLSTITLFAIIGSSIWYVVRFSAFENKTYGKLILRHLMAASVIVALWWYLGAVIAKVFMPGSENLSKEAFPGRILTGYTLYLIFVVFFYAITFYQNLKEKVRRESELKALIKEAELHALKSQLNPHFLFNSLNSISSLTMTNPEKAQEMVINLSSIMRYSLKYKKNEVVTLGTELEYMKLYLNIEKVRFGSKLNPVFAIPENCFNARIPNMILQPLYENAIKYGVYEATEPIDIHTSCELLDHLIKIKITNTYDPGVLPKRGEGIGLRNIKERLQTLYNNPGLMKIENKNNIFAVTLYIPQNV